jgi:ABC-type lipoprotein export system ATPase subunit
VYFALENKKKKYAVRNRIAKFTSLDKMQDEASDLTTIIMITHNRSIAQSADWVLQVSDGVPAQGCKTYENN